jgi:hypothetical protein
MRHGSIDIRVRINVLLRPLIKQLLIGPNERAEHGMGTLDQLQSTISRHVLHDFRNRF